MVVFFVCLFFSSKSLGTKSLDRLSRFRIEIKKGVEFQMNRDKNFSKIIIITVTRLVTNIEIARFPNYLPKTPRIIFMQTSIMPLKSPTDTCIRNTRGMVCNDAAEMLR